MIAGESAGQNFESAGQSLQVKMSLQVKIAACKPTYLKQSMASESWPYSTIK
jgi:hypothetical protein